MTKLHLSLTITITVTTAVICLSLFSCDTVSKIYKHAGSLMGLSPHWVKAHVQFISDYGHVLAYTLLTFLLGSIYKNKLFSITILMATMGSTLEILQMLVPKRQTSFGDLGYNLIGIVTAIILLLLWQLFKKQHFLQLARRADAKNT